MIEIWPELAWRLGVLAFLLAVPLALLVLRRRRVLAAEGDKMLVAWFGYSRVCRLFFQSGWMIWAAVVYGLRLHHLLLLTLGNGAARNVAMAVLLVLPPTLAFLAAHRLTRAAVRHVQGADAEGETLLDAVRYTAGSLWVVPFAVLSAMDAQEKVGLGWWWLAGWFLSAVLISAGRKKTSTELVPQALSVGELRDRIFELAGQAGVALREIYVLPVARFRFANAYAMEADRILLTDFLLAHLSRREVAAIAAHEVDHLRQKRRTPWALFGGCLALFIAGMVLLITTDSMEALFRQLDSPTGPVWPLPFLLLTWVFPARFHSRRQEMKADAGSARLTGDPEALISALVRLSRLNLLPMRWSFLEGILSTHPSTDRRCEALAARFGVPKDRLEQLLAGEGIAEAAAAEDRFELPAAVLAPDRLFTTRVKARAVRALFWASLLPAVGLALGTAFAVRLTGLEGGAAWMAYVAGLVLAIAVTALAVNRLSLLGYQEVGDRLAARLESEGLSPAALGGELAGFAPHGDIRLYEGHTVWDLGFVYLGADELVYAGDQVRFRIPRRDVLAIRPGRQTGFWLPVPDLRVDWRDGDGATRQFRLRSAAGSLSTVRRATRLLGRRLEGWLSGEGGPKLPAALGDLPLPSRSEVTSQPLRGSVTFRQVFFGFLLYSLVTLGLGMVLDLELEALRAALAAGVFVPVQYLPHFLRQSV
jgi:heat shock protein HtpX